MILETPETLTLVCDQRTVFHGGAVQQSAFSAKAGQVARLIPMLREAHRLLEGRTDLARPPDLRRQLAEFRVAVQIAQERIDPQGEGERLAGGDRLA